MATLYGPQGLYLPVIPSLATILLDAAGDKFGGVFIAPKDGTIDRIAIYCTAVAGTVPSYDCRLETVSAGLPTGTLIGTNTNGAQTPTASTLHLVTLTASHSIQAGAECAVSIVSASATGANNATFNGRNNPAGGAGGWDIDGLAPRAMSDLSVGTWSPLTVLPCVSPVYDDGTYFPMCLPNGTNSAPSTASNTTPDERGVRFTQVGKQTCIGFRFRCRPLTAGCNATFKLYPTTADNAAPLASFTWTAATLRYDNQTHWITGYWDGVTLEDGTDYRLTIVPTTTNDFLVSLWTTPSAAARQSVSHCYATSRTRTADGDDGAWTDATDAFYEVTPLYSQSVAAAGGSGAGIPGNLLSGILQ